MSEKTRVLITGIGGASLGTELFKCLKVAAHYDIYGCDISPFAFGHYQEGFRKTICVPVEGYVEAVRSICIQYGIRAIIPGGEEPLRLLTTSASVFEQIGVFIAANSPEVTALCSDKARFFEYSRQAGFAIPQTFSVERNDNLPAVTYPCVVKAATGTGGSNFVFLANDARETALYVGYILANRTCALVQEYIPEAEGEFTIGVLSLRDRRIIGSVAMRRLFDTKLSVSVRTKSGLISSGYSQGLIDDFAELRAQAEELAHALESVGPLNIQGRVMKQRLLPFEVNPRFSASTYLRTMAGFNEVDTYLQAVLYGREPVGSMIRPGYYLRSLSEVHVAKEKIAK